MVFMEEQTQQTIRALLNIFLSVMAVLRLVREMKLMGLHLEELELELKLTMLK